MNNYNTGSVKLRRVLAFTLDFILSFLITSVIIIIVTILYGLSSNIDAFEIDAVINNLGKFSLLLLFRDFIFGGVSLGKRIMGLKILDYTTLKKPSIFKTILRDLFFIILPIDAITMFIEGRSVGDRVANTVVVAKKASDSKKLTSKASAKQSGKVKTPDNTAFLTDDESAKIKRSIISAVIFLLAIIGFLSLVCFGWYSAL